MPARHPAAEKRYRAVTVVAPAGACHSAQKISGKRFLVEQVPAIPLRECDASECNCRYLEYPDRRQDLRRKADSGLQSEPYAGDDRRQMQDRRRRRSADQDDDYFDDDY